jgi:hypothetical protein
MTGNWIIGLIAGVAMAVSLTARETPPPFRTTLVVTGILWSALIVMAARNMSGWKVFAVIVLSLAFLAAQWFYLRSFRTSATAPKPIDPSQDPGEQF